MPHVLRAMVHNFEIICCLSDLISKISSLLCSKVVCLTSSEISSLLAVSSFRTAFAAASVACSVRFSVRSFFILRLISLTLICSR